ncbi:alpha/beta fold hydrolase [uncultured Hymenobacter sp.]|uniref:alpha/beta fold hydrolase n=1 Tax=uncultured Hymenobacter sp. TaxID=170016 RepID=UPI0035CBC237
MRNFIFVCALVLLAGVRCCQAQAIHIVKQGKGTGPAVLFLPGFTSPGSVWEQTICHLPTKTTSYQVSYAGFRGVQPIDTPWYVTIKGELLRYIQNEKLAHLTIVGHSMGGNLAVEIAAALPGKVDKLVLVDAIPCMRALMMPGVPATQLRYQSPYNQQILALSDDAFRQTARRLAQNMATDPAKVDTLVAWALAADRRTYVYGYTDLLQLDLRPLLPQVKARTLILGASMPDTLVVRRTFEQQYATLAVKSIRLAPSSKHFIMFDQPAWFYHQLSAFLTQ